MQTDKKKSRPIYYYKNLKDYPQDILDISDEGLILVNDLEGMIYLRHYSDDTIRIDEPIGNSLENNGVAVGLLVSVEGGCIIVYAG